MSCKEEYIELYKEHIQREGSMRLLDYLENKSDFFTAPASTRSHCAYEGGLCEHSLNVYHCLVDYLMRDRVQELYGLEYTEESIAIVALLHDVCKVGCYQKNPRSTRNPWVYADPLPYGHGEKSVYIISGFMRLTREEAMAIRWHMGHSGPEDTTLIRQALKKYHLALALAIADMEATNLLEVNG